MPPKLTNSGLTLMVIFGLQSQIDPQWASEIFGERLMFGQSCRSG
jgi:hypothetical protein